jgi:hypothetical protein
VAEVDGLGVGLAAGTDWGSRRAEVFAGLRPRTPA